MNYTPYRNSNTTAFNEKPFANANRQTLTREVPHYPQTAQVAFNNPQQYPHSIAPTNTYQDYRKVNEAPLVSNGNQSQTNPIKTSAQTVNTAGVGSQPSVDNRFLSANSQKVDDGQRQQNEPENCNKDYAKKTVLIVLAGFALLMLIVGIGYGIILYNKSHTPSETVVGNLSITGEVVPGIKAGAAHDAEWQGSNIEASHQQEASHYEESWRQALVGHKLHTHTRKHIN